MNTMENKLLLRSDITQQIIKERPLFIEVWAIPFLMIFLMGLFLLTNYVHYSSNITLQGVLYKSIPNVPLTSIREGIFVPLNTRNGKFVKKDDILGWYDTDLNIKQVFILKSKIDSCYNLIEEKKFEKIQSLLNYNFNDIGELKISYNVFFSVLSEKNNFLYKGNPISQINNDQISISKAKRDILEAVNNMKKVVDNWVEQNCLKAPVNGTLFSEKLSFSKVYLAKNDVVAHIVPESGGYYIRIEALPKILKSINEGMTVSIHLSTINHDNYIQGKIFDISSPGGGKLVIIAHVIDSLYLERIPNFSKQIGSEVEVRIKTEDISLFDEIYQSIKFKDYKL